MNRRDAVIALLTAVAAPLASFGQQPEKLRRIAFLGLASASGYVKEIEAIRARLRELGWVEGKNIAFELRWAENSPERLKESASELVGLNVEAIITHAIPGPRAILVVSKTIPIVIADGPDPVATGLVASLSRPGGNITGSTGFQFELAAKRLALLKEVLPRLKRVAVIMAAANPNNAVIFGNIETAAKAIKAELHQILVRALEELAGAFNSAAKWKADVVVIGEDPMLNSNGGAIAALATTHRLPAAGITTFAEAGGLIGYSANRPHLYGRSADFVDKILRGAKPGDLPIERATKFDLIINLRAAKALGLIVPQSLLLRADRVIE